MDIKDQDMDDLTEGYKKRKPKVWKRAPKMDNVQEVVALFLETDDVERVARVYRITKSEVTAILEEAGLI